MRKKLTIMTAALATLLALALPAAAARPAGAGEGGVPEGVACQQAGIGVLGSLGLIDDVAKDGLTVNLGAADGPTASFEYREVLKLHRTMPDLFRTGGGVFVLGAEATWCD